MALRWYVLVPPLGLGAVSAWRLESGLLAAWADEGEGLFSSADAAVARSLWLRIDRPEDWAKRLRGAATAGIWEAEDDARMLRRRGERLPDRAAPTGPWRPLAECLAVGPGPRKLASKPPAQRLPVRLLAWEDLPPADRAAWESAGEAARNEPQAWLGDVRTLHDVVLELPAVRFTGLVFAVDAAGDALVLGRDLPPLPTGPEAGWYGRFQYDLVRPLGWAWSPPVDDATMAGLLREEGEVALCRPGGRIERLAKANFAALTRAAVRATYEPFSHRGKVEQDPPLENAGE